jgi:hypothetical protein
MLATGILLPMLAGAVGVLPTPHGNARALPVPQPRFVPARRTAPTGLGGSVAAAPPGRRASRPAVIGGPAQANRNPGAVTGSVPIRHAH